MVEYIDPPTCPEQLDPSAWSGLRRTEEYNLSSIPAGQDVSDDYALKFMHIYNEIEAPWDAPKINLEL
jgi:hypothetical protein